MKFLWQFLPNVDEKGLEMNEELIWQDLGKRGFESLVADFYRRVKTDDLIGPMYPKDDWDGAERRLAGFLKFRIGKDPAYLNERGHPRLRARHLPFSIGVAERDRWLRLMGAAMDAEGISGQTRDELDAFFAQVADFMRND